MTRPNRFSATLSARAVEAAGSEFAPRGEAIYDAGVALDEILSLTGNVEPVVLRVAAAGGSRRQRESVSGDWLCADHEQPRRIQRPAWSYNAASDVWPSGLEWLEAWETCDNAQLMLVAAAQLDVDRRSVVRAACACARASLHLVPPGEARPMRAIEAAESFDDDSADSATRDRLAAAREGAAEAVTARDPAIDGVPAVAAMSAAAIAALCAVSYAYDTPGFGDAAGGAAFNAALALMPYEPRVPLRGMAGTVRGLVTTEAVLRAVARGRSPRAALR